MKQKNIFKVQSFIRENQQGFTMMEFLVASILGLIVILAVGATYTATARLDKRGEERLAIQQDVRAITSMITRDAHMAGSFGCLSLADYAYPRADGSRRVTPDNVVDSFSEAAGMPMYGGLFVKLNDRFGVRSIPEFPYSSGVKLLLGEKALLFHYGVGSATLDSLKVNNGSIQSATFLAEKASQRELLNTAKDKGALALASCNRLDILRGVANGTKISVGAGLPIGIQGTATASSFHTANNLEVMRYVVHVYGVGTLRNQSGLYRLSLGKNGTWDSPQLLSPYVTGMKIRFGYSDPAKCADDVAGSQENFTFADAVKKWNPPSLLWLQLDVVGEGDAQVDGSTRESVYTATATIRGGNVCASRLLQETP